MNIQEAIDILTDWDTENIHDPSVGIWRDEDMAEAIPLAIQALKEKQEREKPIEPRQDYSFEVGV
jgi:hypothetical protein